MGVFDCCQSDGCCRAETPLGSARRDVLHDLEMLRGSYSPSTDEGRAAHRIYDALIRRVERWDE